MVGGPGRPPEKFPTVAEIEAQIETRNVRRGVGGLFTGRGGNNVTKLPPMPEKPTIKDFFELRFAPANHVLQSATRALKTGMSEEVTLACLLHDCVLSLIKPDHGWWGAQLFEPYIPEKSAFAIRYHQTLRFYRGRRCRLRVSGSVLPDLRPRLHAAAVHRADLQDAQEPQVVHGAAAGDGERSLRVRSERQGVVSNRSSDIIGRHFKQPKEGLGFDNSPSAHMWRTLARPDQPL